MLGHVLGAGMLGVLLLPAAQGDHGAGAIGVLLGSRGAARPLLPAPPQHPGRCVLQKSLGTATTSPRWRTFWTRTAAPAARTPRAPTVLVMPTAPVPPSAAPASAATRARSRCSVRAQRHRAGGGLVLSPAGWEGLPGERGSHSPPRGLPLSGLGDADPWGGWAQTWLWVGIGAG